MLGLVELIEAGIVADEVEALDMIPLEWLGFDVPLDGEEHYNDKEK